MSIDPYKKPFPINSAQFLGLSSIIRAVTPDDDADLPDLPLYVYANGGGNIAYLDATGAEIVDTVFAGQPMLARPTRIFATGTTATGLRAAYISSEGLD